MRRSSQRQRSISESPDSQSAQTTTPYAPSLSLSKDTVNCEQRDKPKWNRPVLLGFMPNCFTALVPFYCPKTDMAYQSQAASSEWLSMVPSLLHFHYPQVGNFHCKQRSNEQCSSAATPSAKLKSQNPSSGSSGSSRAKYMTNSNEVLCLIIFTYSSARGK